MSARDRRALAWLAVALILAAVYQFWPAGGPDAAVAATPESVGAAEVNLERLRRIAATLPAKQDVYKSVQAELAQREAGLIRAETGAQAQAQLITLLGDLGNEAGFQLRATELRNAVAPLGDAYGEASVTVQFECRIEQLVNFLASLAAQEQIITTRDLQINASNARQKTINVRLTASAVVPRQLVPDKKGGAF
jgi:Tfp pilus assembly protein PilO